MVIAASAKFPEIGRSFYEAGPAYANEKIAAISNGKGGRYLKRRDPRLTAMQFVDLVQSVVPSLASSASKHGRQDWL